MYTHPSIIFPGGYLASVEVAKDTVAPTEAFARFIPLSQNF